jgi:hypothetical protein
VRVLANSNNAEKQVDCRLGDYVSSAWRCHRSSNQTLRHGLAFWSMISATAYSFSRTKFGVPRKLQKEPQIQKSDGMNRRQLLGMELSFEWVLAGTALQSPNAIGQAKPVSEGFSPQRDPRGGRPQSSILQWLGWKVEKSGLPGR